MDGQQLRRASPPPGPTNPFAVPRTITAPAAHPPVDLADPSLYFNRELSWLDFNWRVLYQAMDDRLPLLERVRFVAIAQSNLDEFFRTRVGGLKRRVDAGVTLLSPDGRSPGDQLRLIHEAVVQMLDAMDRAWRGSLHPALCEHGICIRDYDSLRSVERRRLALHFRRMIYPVLTPLVVDPGHPFPFISDLSLSLAVVLVHPVRPGRQFARGQRIPGTLVLHQSGATSGPRSRRSSWEVSPRARAKCGVTAGFASSWTTMSPAGAPSR